MPLNRQLRKLWVDAGYSSHMGSAAVVPPPQAQYRRVYYLTTAEYGLSNIVFRRLEVARFSQLNDPFELLAPKFTDRKMRDEVGKFKNAIDKEDGLLCFSSDWTDPVLWSHYGAKHTGICLGFDVEKSILRHVKYQSSRIVHH